MQDFGQAFLALVAVSNLLPMLPIVVDHTSGLAPSRRRRFRLAALVQANAVALGFLLAAGPVFAALALTTGDLQMAGGVVLLTYACHDLLFSKTRRNQQYLESAVHPEQQELLEGPPIAPLGVPIMVGPATLSLVLLLSERHGTGPVIGAMGATVAVNAVILLLADALLRLLGEGTARALGKVSSLVLAALGAGMLRAGVQAMLGGH